MSLAELLTGVWVRGELWECGDSKAVVASLKSSPQLGLRLIKAASQSILQDLPAAGLKRVSSPGQLISFINHGCLVSLKIFRSFLAVVSFVYFLSLSGMLRGRKQLHNTA